MIYFVNQKRHSTDGTWVNNTIVKENGTDQQNYYDAIHQFHAFMSTYGYGYAEGVDFVSCSLEAENSRIIKNEIDDRRVRESNIE